MRKDGASANTNEVSVRFRSAALMSTAAIAALALAGCAGEGPSTDDASTNSEDALCAAAGASGAEVEGLGITGSAADGAPESIDLSDPLDPEEFERAVVTEGDGEQLAEGDFLSYAIAAYDAETGEQIDAAGYDEDDAIQPAQLSSTTQLGVIFGCATVGSRIVTVYPSTTDESGNTAAAEIQVIDVLSTPAKKAWGEDQEPVDGMPTVELAESGEPTITIPDGMEVPDTTEVEVLKQGDGATVTENDTAYVQYTGVKVSDGETFDSSWSRDPQVTQFPISGVVAGFQTALIGQKVGSQVVAVIPKDEAYHIEGREDNELYDEDLVFVVDILDTYTPATTEAE